MTPNNSSYLLARLRLLTTLNKTLLSGYILLFGMIANSSQADITFAYVIKERAYRQTGNQPVESILEWNVSAGVSGDSLVSAGSVTYPGGSAAFTGENGNLGWEPDDYYSQEALDVVFPNGEVSLSITDNGVSQDYGPFSLTGDAYPETPFITNSEALQSADLSQDFTLEWDAFSSAKENDEILFIIEDNIEDGNPVVMFLPASSTSFLIPAGTLAADGDYLVQVMFIRKTAPSPESVDIKIGYITQTRVGTRAPKEYPYGNWAEGINFMGKDSSAQGDPDRDGLINLLEMIFGTNPTFPGDLPLVKSVIVTDGGTDYPGVEITQIPSSAGIDSHVEAATDPQFLNALSQVEVGAAEVLGDGRERRLFRSETPLNGTARIFFRLSVDAVTPE